MAFIRDYVVTEFSVAAASGTGEMPVHQSGDMLIVFTNKDTNAAMTEVGGNYTNLTTQGGTDSMWGATWYRRAASDAEPEPSFTWSSETAIIIVVAVGNPHPSNNPTGTVLSADDATIPYTQSTNLNTPSDNCLVLYGCSIDQVQGPTPWPTDMQTLHGGDVTAGGMGLGFMFYPSSGTATSGVRFFANSADSTRIFTVIIEDDGNNSIVPAYIDQDSAAPDVITTLGGAALTFNGNSNTVPTTLLRTSGTQVVIGRDFTQCWSYDGSNYTDETTDMNDTGTGDVTFTNTTSGIFYFGYSEPFYQMAFDVGTAGTGSPTAVWEYWNGGSWTTIPGFPTQNFTSATFQVNRFSPPADWATTSVNSVSAYYIRRRQTANWTIAAVIDQGAVNGMGYLYDTPGATADSGLNPYWTSYALSGPTTVPDTTNQVGSEVAFSNALDLDPGYILTTFTFVNARDSIDVGTYKKYKGVSVGLWSGADAYKVWTVAAKDGRDTSSDNRITIGIQPTQSTDTAWAAQGSLNSGAVSRIGFTASHAVAAVTAQFSGLWFVNGSAILSGGSAANPLTFSELGDALIRGSGLFPVVINNGAATTYYVPLQMGGSDPAHFGVNLGTFQFPTQASATNKTGTWHVDENIMGIEFYGQSGDTMHFTACTFISDTSFYWRFNSSASGSADWDFTGSTIANAVVTLRSAVPLDSITFNGCAEITLNGADLSNCTLQNQRDGNNLGAVAFTSSSEGDGITSCTFIDNNDGDLGHSIRITGTGTYTFDGHQFSGGGVAERSFNTFSGVNEGTDVVTTDSAHGYAHGDAIYYQDQGGTTLGGLTDGNLYYVRAVSSTTLAFYSTKANALADSSRIALTAAGSPGETHYIYSAKADVYNASGGSVTINIANGGDTPSIRNSNGSTTSVNNAVTLSLSVKDSNGVAIQNAQVWIQKDADDADAGHPGNPFTSSAGNNQGDSDFVVNETPPGDLPASGWLRVKTGRDEQTYRYASKSATTFTLNSEVTGTDNGSGTTTVINETNIGTKNIVEGDTIRNTTANPDQWAIVLSVSTNSVTTTPLSGGSSWASAAYSVHRLAVNYKSGSDTAVVPLMNEQTDGSGLAAQTYNYLADKDILVRIRLASGSPDYLPFSTAGTITSSGYTLAATLQSDTIKS